MHCCRIHCFTLLAKQCLFLLHAAVQPTMVEAVRSMLSNIRDAFREAFELSSWVTGEDRRTVIQKLANMKTYVGSPGGRLEQASLEKLYSPFPDVPLDQLFPSWIKAVSLSSHQMWADQTTWIFDEAAAGAHYEFFQNALVVPMGIIHRPVYHDNGPPALNYGGLGSIVGHEMMHAYDVSGRGFDENGTARRWASDAFTREYKKRTLCIRRSHRAAVEVNLTRATLPKKCCNLSREHNSQLRQRALEEVDDFTDSENLADFVGVRIAFEAFSSLSHHQRRSELVGTNISTERLFFIGYCANWCAEYSDLAAHYAPYRSRCIVPLMNMPEFSNAFGCTEGLPMNPREKCSFWS